MSAKKAAAKAERAEVEAALPSLPPIPSVTQFLFAALDITEAEKERVKALMDAYGFGTQAFHEALDRFMNERVTPVRLQIIVNRVKLDLVNLLNEGHGPTESDMVDLA